MPARLHDFLPCMTPPASGRKWYRCSKCNAFGWKKRGKHVTYKCTVPKCNRNATDRLPGLGGRSPNWRCDDHGSRSIDPDSQAP